jgi:uncharacterized protein YqgQ
MSPWFILFLSKLDAVLLTAKILLVISVIMIGGFGFGGVLADEQTIIDFFKKYFKRIFITPVICIIILLTVPDRNTAILMWVLPKLSQSQLIQKDFPEMYEKAMKILNEEIDKKLNGDKK